MAFGILALMVASLLTAAATVESRVLLERWDSCTPCGLGRRSADGFAVEPLARNRNLAYRRGGAVEVMRRISALAALAAFLLSGSAWGQAKSSAASAEGLSAF